MRAARMRIVAAACLVLAVAAGAAVAVGAAGSGGADERSSLAWQGKPTFVQSGAVTDRVFQTQLRNDSLREVDLVANDVELLDERGKPVQSTARFLQAFAHGIYSWSMTEERGDFERRRLGEIATLKPGQTIPVTLSWRVPQGGEQPVRVDFGDVSLKLPEQPAKLAVAPIG